MGQASWVAAGSWDQPDIVQTALTPSEGNLSAVRRKAWQENLSRFVCEALGRAAGARNDPEITLGDKDDLTPAGVREAEQKGHLLRCGKVYRSDRDKSIR